MRPWLSLNKNMNYFNKLKQLSSRQKRLIRVLLLILSITLILYIVQTSRELKTVKIGDCSFKAELANSNAEHYKGLSNRKDMDNNRAMLFLFQDKQDRSFVMRDMHFPLDIIFISDSKVVNLFHNLTPEGSEPTRSYESGTPVEAVLEIKGGLSRSCKIGVRTEVNWQ